MAKTDAEPPFQSVAIVGFGLIGGSIALGVRERWPAVRITGLDRSSVLAHASGSGAIDRAAQSVGDLGRPDLVILAAPIEENIRLLPEVLAQAGPGAVITDVGGTKRDMVSAAARVGASTSFVGGHPIGGAERGGFGFARADLFRGRPWVFTPGESSPSVVVERLCAFAQGLGARPVMMATDEHDRLMAFLSHLPQLTSSVLMEVVGRAAGAEGLRLAGRGLLDTTRLASSPADIWRDVCRSNADAIGVAIDALIERLREVRADLSDAGVVDTIFEDAARWRGELTRGRE
jgi:prephenate dehydrogenase